jgi:predicted  nucleic acid-binding Zn-ribbon protein
MAKANNPKTAAAVATVERPANLSAEVAAEGRRVLLAAEECLRRIIEANPGYSSWTHPVNSVVDDESNLVFAKCGWDRNRIKTELGRMARILHRQRDAGTPDDRQEAAHRLELAKVRLQNDGPALREKIERLRDQLTGVELELGTLEAEVEGAEMTIARQRAALEELRPLVPEFIRREVAHMKSSHEPERRRILEIRDRLKFIDDVALLSKELASSASRGATEERALIRGALAIAEKHCPEAIEIRAERDDLHAQVHPDQKVYGRDGKTLQRGERVIYDNRVYPEKFKKFSETLASERPALLEELESLQTDERQLEQSIAELERGYFGG